jgi:hypothetical protein
MKAIPRRTIGTDGPVSYGFRLVAQAATPRRLPLRPLVGPKEKHDPATIVPRHARWFVKAAVTRGAVPAAVLAPVPQNEPPLGHGVMSGKAPSSNSDQRFRGAGEDRVLRPRSWRGCHMSLGGYAGR